LARGDRSREGRERTAEERERDREERARKRAVREGAAPLAEAGLPPSAQPGVEGGLGEDPLYSEQPPAPVPGEHPHPETGPEALPTHAEPAAELPQPAGPPASEDAEFDAAALEAAALEAAHEAEPAHRAPAAAKDPAAATTQAHEPVDVAGEPHPEPGHAELPPEPDHGEQPLEPAIELPPGPVTDTPQEAAIELSAEPSEPVGSLPPLPPAASSSQRSRRASAEDLPPVASSTPRRRNGRSRRSLLGRVGALIALVAAIVAVILVVHSLSSSTKTTTAPASTVVRVVIPEGLTRVQIGELAAKYGLRGSYRAASRHSPLLNPSHYGAPSSTPDLEGFLFPATYDEYPRAPVSRLVAEQLIAFKENFSASLSARARALHVTPYQLLIVASMIEREAQVPGDRAKIAAVIYNRLEKEIPLGIDATIYYAVELQKGIGTYTQELTESQLHINSPYNTRTHVGLPPTPISNPGLASIEAAAKPAHVPYLYYVAGADGCGEQVFSTTLAAFEANVAAYQAAVKKNGGKPPSCNKK
jgi:UPF0755 protein